LDPEDHEKVCALLSIKKTPYKGTHEALLITKWVLISWSIFTKMKGFQKTVYRTQQSCHC
jgi:hypothetical protein